MKKATVLRHLGALIATLVIGVGVQVAVGVPAGAAPAERDCVTRAEFAKIKAGKSRLQVRKMLGAKGRLTAQSVYGDGEQWLSYAYRECGRAWSESSVSVLFSRTVHPVADPAAAEAMPAEQLQDYYPVEYAGPLVVRDATWG